MSFYTKHLYVPLIIWTFIIIIWTYFDLDFYISSLIYKSNNYKFHNEYILTTIIHVYGKFSIILTYLSLISLFIYFKIKKKLKHIQKGLLYVIITGLASIIIIALLKSKTIYACPYNTIDLGGTSLHYNILNKFPFGKTNGNCFPAGHASGPYSLISFYFFALKYNPKYTRISLAIPIVLGLVFDISQQLRGAHFVTHGMFTLAICWICSVYGYKYILNNK